MAQALSCNPSLFARLVGRSFTALWNHRTFSRGKRSGHSPLELATDSYVPSLADALDAILQPQQQLAL
ncbi:hypothetical protein KFU94_65940 [Chloroflexi bacterium TSY]|nr:hypothetical protein [Chloroflexi bacterium TSY]